MTEAAHPPSTETPVVVLCLDDPLTREVLDSIPDEDPVVRQIVGEILDLMEADVWPPLPERLVGHDAED